MDAFIKYQCYKIILIKYYLASKIIIFHLIKLFSIQFIFLSSNILFSIQFIFLASNT